MSEKSSPYDLVEPGIKIANYASAEPTDAELALWRQMDVRHVVCWTDSSKASGEYYASCKTRYAEHGIEVYGFGNADVHNQDAIVLGTEQFEAKVDEYVRHIRALGQAGIHYTTYAHMPNGIWSTEPERTRGGATTRGFDLDRATYGDWVGKRYHLPLTNGREYSEDEAWGYFERFIGRAARAAEEEGVMIGIHPDDPPIPRLGGVPRIFSTFADYQRAFEIAGSPNVGVCLCIGCWLEGGEVWGVDALEAIRRFAAQKKLFKVHFRNVDRPLPHFVETFVDDGFFDMYQAMKTMQEVGFKGIAIPDHVPHMGDDERLGLAYTVGYMNALKRRAEQEVGVRA